MKKIYATTIINTGGRTGEVHSPDNSFQLNIVQPGQRVDGATNPEQLFAAGYSACFNGALSFVLESEGITAASEVKATVTLYSLGEGPVPNVGLGVAIEGHVDGLSLEQTQALLDKAHHICPYSKATQGNIEVTVTAY